MKTLVTGGAGFIGSHLVDRLLELGHDVVVIDDFSSGKPENLKHQDKNRRLNVIKADICGDINKYFAGVDVVFHVAAVPRVQYSIKFPEITNKVNVAGTVNVLEASRKAGVKKIVYSASSSAYGDQDTLPLVETMLPNPMSPYAVQKLVGEYYCRLYWLIHKIPTFSLRYFNVYGPRQDPSGGYACLIPRTIMLVSEGKSPVIYGDGEQTRDFTYVKDVVEANIAAMNCTNEKAFGEVFNIGAGKNFSVNHVCKAIIGSKKISSIHQDPVVEPHDTLADISKAKKLLGWTPAHSFERAIKDTRKSYGFIDLL